MRIFNLMLAAVMLISTSGCLTVGPVSLAAPDKSGEPLLYADQGVRIERPVQGEIPYQPAMVLMTGDRVSTTSGQAVIDFDDDNIVVLNRNTSIALGSIRLFLGEVFTRIKKLARRGGGQVLTDEISASVAGTRYAVRRSLASTNPDVGSTRVIVRTGEVYCEPGRTGSWKPLAITADEALHVGPYSGAPEVTRADAAAETRWAELAEERLLRPRPTAPNVQFVLPILSPRRDDVYKDDHY